MTRAHRFLMCSPLRLSPLAMAWQAAYGLSPDAISPPAEVVLPASVPAAPHLQDCSARTAAREAAESRGRGGEEPQWARGGECCECGPQPPWVTGSDASNLALTRVAQRDLWRSQFPATCEGRRLLVVEWACPYHGTGSMVHVLSAHFSMALRSNRTLVVRDKSFHRANNAACTALGQEGEWECYFFPITAPDCRRIAMAALASPSPAVPWLSSMASDWEALLLSEAPVLACNDSGFHADVLANKLWGPPAFERPVTLEEVNHTQVPHNNRNWDLLFLQEFRWWRAQVTRFLFRWPSAHLCHFINRARHDAYGLSVAQQLAAAAAQQSSILLASPPGNGGGGGAAVGMVAAEGVSEGERQYLASVGVEAAGGGGLAQECWPMAGLAACTTCVHGEPFIPRPYLSVHVRLSDKGSEMALRFFPSFLFFAYKIRAHVPNLHHVWLSSEMQFIIDEAAQYPDWTFLFTNSSRVRDAQEMADQVQFNRQPHMPFIFANLVISSQADYFVGAHASNWNQLINELRQTGGRLHAGYLALNDAW
ncbi:unnamed protein product [Closterium sp. NIES-65]|nr:unnamed protein product [Closterium sp. NIES-65]